MAHYKNRWISLTLAVAITLGTLLPFFATYNIPAASSKLASIFGEKILICTGQGFAFVNWTDVLAGKTPVKPHKDLACPLCYVAAHSLDKMLPSATAAIPIAYEKSAGLSLFSLDARLRQLAWATSRSRAPPFPFIG